LTKQLQDILYKVSLASTKGDMTLEINQLEFDSRKVTQGSVFIAMPGTLVDGHEFIDKAIQNGAKVIVCEKMPENLQEDITYVQVVNAPKSLGLMAANFYGHPSEKLKLVAVTGTNGKTTSVTLLHQLFMELGYGSGLISTVENKINHKIFPSTHTTPDAISINKLLVSMLKEGCTHCFMEASSHAIIQEELQVYNLPELCLPIFPMTTWITMGTLMPISDAKKKLFDELPKTAFALVNADDKRGIGHATKLQGQSVHLWPEIPSGFQGQNVGKLFTRS
jgi:UDP-N-acetylmuramoyl-L-alanyl-D-glutamate--2,6-diaminopimelate ligase